MAFSGSLLGVSSSYTCHMPSAVTASFRSSRKNLNTETHFVDSTQPDELQQELDLTVKTKTGSSSRRLNNAR